MNSPASVQNDTPLPAVPQGLGVSAYDRVASLLIALLILVGLAVSILFIMWLTNRVFVAQEDVPVEYIEPLAAGDSLGDARDLEEPGEEEVEDLAEPQMEETLDAVTEAISAQQATLETFEGEARSSTKGQGGGGRLGEGGTADIIPRWERWEILFSTSTLDVYAEQLDSFGIELAAVGGGSPTIDYAYNLTKRTPDRRSGKATDEERIYFAWRKGKLQSVDRQLLEKAGVKTTGRIRVQFYPPSTVNLLAKAEHDYAPNVDVKDIAKTVFGIKTEGRQHRFYVVEQKKRRGQ